MTLTLLDQLLAFWLLLTVLSLPIFAILATLWIRGRDRFRLPWADYPPISVIKPMRGAAPELLDNLASTLQTGYPGRIELLCCVEFRDDPAVAVIQQLIDRFAGEDIQLVISEGKRSHFGKHANMLAGYAKSRHSIVVFSDADVRLPRGILQELIPPLFAPGIGGSTSVFFQAPGTGFASWLMAAFIANFGFIPNLAARQLRMLPNAIGGLMAYRRDLLKELGDLEVIIADKISDDGALGVAIRATGKELYLCSQPFYCVREEKSAEAVLRNVHRWMLMYKSMGTLAYFQMLTVSPLFPWLLWLLLALTGLSGITVAQLLALLGVVLLWETATGALFTAAFHPEPQTGAKLGAGRVLAHLIFLITWIAALVYDRTSWGGRRYQVPFGGRARLLGVE